MPTRKSNQTTLVLGSTGKTGRRVAERLMALDLPVRPGSRSATPAFDWDDTTTWAPALRDVTSVYVSYYPDLAAPGAAVAIQSFTELAVQNGVRRLVLLSGRGEEEAQQCEDIVINSGIEWTVLRATWFSQNFSESFLRDPILEGVVALPVGEVAEPFVDADDIADIAVAALTQDTHVGQLYELTGPRLLTFADAVGEIASATGRTLRYEQISHGAFVSGLTQAGVPAEYVTLLSYLFTTILDGRNAQLTDGVQRALGRAPRDFREYVRNAAASGVWDPSPVPTA